MSTPLTLALRALLAELHLMQDGLEGRLVHAGLEPPRDAGEVLAEGLVKHLQQRGTAEGMSQSRHQPKRGVAPAIEQFPDVSLNCR